MYEGPAISLPTRASDGVRVLHLEPNARSAELLRPPTRAHPGGGVVLPSYAAVELGERIDVEMSGPRGSMLKASGVVRTLIPRGRSRAPWIHILLVRTHAHRINHMIDLCSLASREASKPQPRVHPTVLRVRGETPLLESLTRPSREYPGGAVELAWRGPRRIGQPVKVEVSLGAMADPIELMGIIRSVKSTNSSGPSAAKIELSQPHGHRLAYVIDVIRGQRYPTTRAHPRFHVDLEGRWWMGARAESQVIEDLSRGGAFVPTRSEQRPSVGAVVPLEIVDSHGVPLRLESEVVWLSRDPARRGFGTRFRIAQRELSERLSDLLEREVRGEVAWA